MSALGRVYSVAPVSDSQPQPCAAPDRPAAASRTRAPKAGKDARSEDELSQQLPQLLPRLWRFALRLTRDSCDAEDLLQRACVRALERQHQLQRGTSTISWLFSIMHSIWLNELRARRVRGHGSIQWSDEPIEPVAHSAAFDPETHALHQQIVSLVERLPDEQRAVMLLVAVEGLSYREAARALDIPIGTVMSRLARARLSIGESCSGRRERPPGDTGS